MSSCVSRVKAYHSPGSRGDQCLEEGHFHPIRRFRRVPNYLRICRVLRTLFSRLGGLVLLLLLRGRVWRIHQLLLRYPLPHCLGYPMRHWKLALSTTILPARPNGTGGQGNEKREAPILDVLCGRSECSRRLD